MLIDDPCIVVGSTSGMGIVRKAPFMLASKQHNFARVELDAEVVWALR